MSIVVDNIVSFIVCRFRSYLRGSQLRTTLPSGVFFLCTLLTANAQTPDTLKRTTLEEVSISAQRTPSETRTAAPTQVVDAEKLEHLGALLLSDALKQMAGVTIKDYGGVGGIKTVSARGLGSQFSAVTIDGIPVDDSQNGQVDLGRYLLGNSAYVSFSQGQEQGSLLSARAYAAGNTLNMETAEPQFWPGEHVKLKAGAEVGSFGLFSPTLTWEQRWSKRLKSSFFVNYLKSDGDYPFTLYYTASHNDSSSVERRKHSTVWMTTADGNLFYTIGEDNTLVTKVHYMRGAHELPGPVVFYTQTVSEQSSTEELAFVQSQWRVQRERWKLQVLGKLRYSYDDYTDSTANNDIYNEYRQREAYLSATFQRQLASWLDLTLAVDGDLSHLRSNLEKRNDVTRHTLLAAAALHSEFAFRRTKLEADAHLLFNDVVDRVADLDTLPTYRRLSPFLSVMYSLGGGTTLRMFYKMTYRAPNFGELYFFQLFPRNLRPEQAHQVNLGITHVHQWETASLQATCDLYTNHVKDKIIAKPTTNMYYWSMENLGIVDILGLDATAEFHLSPFTFHLNYSYQHAVDHSKEGSKTYGHQIVYTPRHSGGASVRWENRWVNLGATLMVVGDRYSLAQNIEQNRLPAYCDLGLSADRKIDLRLGTLSLRLQVLNLLDTQYEVVRAYPMMGRNWKVNITYEF